MFRGGLDAFGPLNASAIELEWLDLIRWRATIRLGDQRLNATVEGRWEAVLRRGFVERLHVELGGERSYEWSYEDWTFDPSIERWVAKRARYSDSRGQQFRLDYGRGWLESRAAIEAAMRLPDFGQSDAVRGSLKISLISDLRVSPAVHKAFTASGIAVTTDEQLIDVAAERRARLRRSGWFMCGFVVFGLLSVRVARGNPQKKEYRNVQ